MKIKIQASGENVDEIIEAVDELLNHMRAYDRAGHWSVSDSLGDVTASAVVVQEEGE